MQRLRLWAVALACCVIAPLSSWAANFDVANDAELRSAITSAGSGDTITFTSNANHTLNAGIRMTL